MTIISTIAQHLRHYYHQEIRSLYLSQILSPSSILEINRPDNKPLRHIYKNIKKTAEINDSHYPHGKYEYILLPDALSECQDIQVALKTINLKHCTSTTRLIINYHSFLWLPLINLAETIGIKKRQSPTNWLNQDDLSHLLKLEYFEIINTGQRFLIPFNLGPISILLNRYFSQLPLVKNLCLIRFIIARPLNHKPKIGSISIVIPAKNEAKNIKPLVKKIPKLNAKTEVIFVESGSVDNTWDEIKSLPSRTNLFNIKRFRCQKPGKASAVLCGFSKAKGDLLIILDADQTVKPQILNKFLLAATENQGELIIGSRLVYPLENDSMRTLNILANRVFSWIFSWLLNQKIKDTLCGTKVITKHNFQRLLANNQHFVQKDPFGDFLLLFGASRLNLKILEIPVRYQPRQFGSSNISRFHHGLQLLRMALFGINKIKYQ